MKVLITGGSGSLGSALVGAIAGTGHAVRVMSRRARPRPERNSPVDLEWAQADLASGHGLREALAGIDAILHAASDPRNADVVDVGGTRRLVEAARPAGVAHLIYISIVGVDDIPLGYYKRKVIVEGIIRSSAVPHSIVRATQFHSLVNSFVSTAARVPLVMPLPTDFTFQSVAKSEVARRLARCLTEGPCGRAVDFGGPEVLTLGDMARTWMEVKGTPKKLLHLPIPGAVAAAFRAGKNTAPAGDRGAIRWREWLGR